MTSSGAEGLDDKEDSGEHAESNDAKSDEPAPDVGSLCGVRDSEQEQPPDRGWDGCDGDAYSYDLPARHPYMMT